MNTHYKHREVLANNCFKYEAEGIECYVTHEYYSDHTKSVFNISADGENYVERLTEYFFEVDEIRDLCAKHGLHVRSCVDGENFGVLKHNSQRVMFTAQKMTGLPKSKEVF